MANAIRIYLSHIGIKLWKNEKTYKENNNENWYAINDRGYPKGTPQLVGYRIGYGTATMCAIKLLKIYLTKNQEKIMKMMCQDGVKIFEANERHDGNIDLFEWISKNNQIIKARQIIYVKK